MNDKLINSLVAASNQIYRLTRRQQSYFCASHAPIVTATQGQVSPLFKAGDWVQEIESGRLGEVIAANFSWALGGLQLTIRWKLPRLAYLAKGAAVTSEGRVMSWEVRAATALERMAAEVNS